MGECHNCRSMFNFSMVSCQNESCENFVIFSIPILVKKNKTKIPSLITDYFKRK